MSNTDSGVLFLNEWLEVMSSLPAKDYKAIVQAIYNFQVYDIPPPEFKGNAGLIALFIFPCIERRKEQARRGRAGAAARYSRRK